MLRAFRWFHTLDVIMSKKVGKLVKKKYFLRSNRERTKKDNTFAERNNCISFVN
jgi:hypothetical protein